MAVKKPVWFTTVVNQTENYRPFGYLGQYGRSLHPQHSLTFPGNLWSMLAERRTSLLSLERDWKAGRILLILTPAPHSKKITKLGSADPTWTQYARR